MTAQSLIELTLDYSPHLDPAIAEIYLREALREFCEQSRIIRKRFSFTTASKTHRHVLSTPADMLNIRQVTKAGVELINTDAPSYLSVDNGFWFIETNTPITMYLGWWDGSAEQEFDSGEEFYFLYEAYSQEFAKDSVGNSDYTAEPEIPSRFHESLVYRASEKAWRSDPEQRRYFYTLWRDQIREAKKYANTMNTNAKWNVKVYDL